MLELYKDKQTNLEFGLNISGNSFTPEARLCITLYEGLAFVIKAEVQNNIATVKVPPLNDYIKSFPSTSVYMELEVIADQNFFTPWKGQATISTTMSVGVTNVQSEKIENKKEIKVESSLIKKDNKIKFI